MIFFVRLRGIVLLVAITLRCKLLGGCLEIAVMEEFGVESELVISFIALKVGIGREAIESVWDSVPGGTPARVFSGSSPVFDFVVLVSHFPSGVN